MDIVMDAEETRAMILDVIGKPLEALNGQMKLLVNQNSNIEIQTTKTNGRVSSLEEWKEETSIKLATSLPHHVEDCPQGPTLNDIKKDIGTIKIDVNTLKTGKIERGKFRDALRANIGAIIIFLGLCVSIYVGLSNHKQNQTAINNQVDIKKAIREIIQDDSTLIRR